MNRPTAPPAFHATPLTQAAPDPARVAAILARTWIEVRTGRRPLEQLLPFVAPPVRRRLIAQLPAASGLRHVPAATVRRVIAGHPTPDVCEATVLLAHDERVTALAIRLERYRHTWRIAELSAPEAGLRPLATTRVHRWADAPPAAAVAGPAPG